MKPFQHAKISAHKFGGEPEDYIHIHDWFDSTKAHVPDATHRVILHNSFGIYLCEQVFGNTFKNSKNKTISVRSIGEQHVLDDLGFIPSLSHILDLAALHEKIVGGIRKVKKVIVMEG